MENLGWIKLHRSFLESRWFKKAEYVHLWIYLLMKVNHKDSYTNDMGIMINAGQLFTGRKVIAYDLGLSESKVERMLNTLESSKQIEQQKTTKYRIISITNWHKYQHSEQHFEQQMNNKRTTSEQQVNTYKNDKNVKNEKNNIMCDDFERFWQAYPKRSGTNPKAPAKKAFLKAIKKHEPSLIINKAVLLANSLSGEVSPYTPMATTWLNQERFLDEICEDSKNDDLMRFGMEAAELFKGVL